jgi:hypothetical protein
VAAGSTFKYVSEDALRTQQVAATDPKQQSLLDLMLAYADGDKIDMRETLAEFPGPLTSVQEYARQVLVTAPVA